METLIQAVEAEEVIWNKSNPDYFDRNRKHAAWLRVMGATGLSGKF